MSHAKANDDRPNVLLILADNWRWPNAGALGDPLAKTPTFDRIAREGVSPAELERVRTQWVASEVYKLDSVMNQARELGSYWALGLPPDTGEQLLARLRQITPAQVQSVAARYFGDDQLTVATLLPQPLDKTARPRTATPGARH